MIERLDEKIDVLATFIGGKIKIIRFRWKNTTLKVEKTTSRWMKREGPYPVYFFSVLVNKNDVYELSFNSRTMSWKLKTIYMEG